MNTQIPANGNPAPVWNPYSSIRSMGSIRWYLPTHRSAPDTTHWFTTLALFPRNGVLLHLRQHSSCVTQRLSTLRGSSLCSDTAPRTTWPVQDLGYLHRRRPSLSYMLRLRPWKRQTHSKTSKWSLALECRVVPGCVQNDLAVSLSAQARYLCLWSTKGSRQQHNMCCSRWFIS